MNKYQAIYARTETRSMFIYCEAESTSQAIDIFDKMVEDSVSGDTDNPPINFDDMECIDAEEYIQDIELIKETHDALKLIESREGLKI